MATIIMPTRDDARISEQCRAYLEDLLGAKAFKALADAAAVPAIPDLISFTDNLGYEASKAKLQKLQDQARKVPYFRADAGQLSQSDKYSPIDVNRILHGIKATGEEYNGLIMTVVAAAVTQSNSRAMDELVRVGSDIYKRANELDDLASKMLGQIVHMLAPFLLMSTEERYQGADGTARLVRHIQRNRELVLDRDYGMFQTVLPIMLKYDNKCSAMDKAIAALGAKTWEQVKDEVILKTCNRAYGSVRLPASPATGGSTREYSYVITCTDGKLYFKHHEATPNGVQFTASTGYSADEIITDVSLNVDAYMQALLG